MDASKVAALAARHRVLQAAAHLRQPMSDAESTERLRQQVDAYWQQLGIECSAFCDAYNNAFGSDRLYTQVHADTIVVRAAEDPQETITFSRTSLTNPHGGHISAHRYSSRAAPADLAIDGHVDGYNFVLTAEGQPTTVEQAALRLLERFTEELLPGLPASQTGDSPIR
jgi:hypothetical protein